MPFPVAIPLLDKDRKEGSHGTITLGIGAEYVPGRDPGRAL
jgi:hypothetical protein